MNKEVPNRYILSLNRYDCYGLQVECLKLQPAAVLPMARSW
ncbi:hypothetical protein [Roseimaritima ulvae]|nr:hypothetical protein [Roseimaritima ulvae]